MKEIENVKRSHFISCFDVSSKEICFFDFLIPHLNTISSIFVVLFFFIDFLNFLLWLLHDC